MTDETKAGEVAARVRNALKHGLTAVQSVLVPGEDATLYDGWLGLWLTELRPIGAVEEFLAHRVAAAAWRLLRVERLEGALASTPIAEVGELLEQRKDEEGGGWHIPDPHRYDALPKLARHEAAIERAFFRALRALQEAQAERGRAAAATTKRERARR
jgi:hypothetical protein